MFVVFLFEIQLNYIVKNIKFIFFVYNNPEQKQILLSWNYYVRMYE